MDQEIKQAISQALNALKLPEIQIELERPADDTHGDYSTNIAMVLFPQLKKEGKGEPHDSPRELAQALADQLITQNTLAPIVEKVEVAGAGFINFKLSTHALITNLESVFHLQSRFGFSNQLNDLKIVVEYTDPNPFKEFHIGHLYSNAVGESLARLYQAMGATVWRADYYGDVGIHVAKAVWALLLLQKQQGLNFQALNKESINDRQKILGQAYAMGAKAFEEDPPAKAEIEALNTNLYVIAQKMHQKQSNWQPLIDYGKFAKPITYNLDEVTKTYELGRTWSLEYFETVYQRVGTKFDGYYPESLVGEIGYKLVKDGLEQGSFIESEGAVVFPGEKYGLHTRVFINKLGLPTYEAKELGLAPKKYEDFQYDKSVIVTANEINEYFKVLIEALKQVNPKLGNITQHIGHGVVRLPEGKMSSRTGTVVTGDSLINQARDAALDIINANNPNLGNKELVADQIGIAAIKYAFLKSNIGSDIVFKLSEAVSFNGNSGPYLQYTHARACSVLSKANNSPPNNTHVEGNPNPQELAVLRSLQRYPEVVGLAGTNNAPHLLCTYLYELAGVFNTFYNAHSILGTDKNPLEESSRNFRLNLTAATAQVLKNGLYCLGIAAPEKM